MKPHLKEQWCLPPGEPSGDFVAHMEDVLEVYHRPYNESKPVVCLDEVPKQLVSEVRLPCPPRPGRPTRYDYEYKREGVVGTKPLPSCASPSAERVRPSSNTGRSAKAPANTR